MVQRQTCNPVQRLSRMTPGITMVSQLPAKCLQQNYLVYIFFLDAFLPSNQLSQVSLVEKGITRAATRSRDGVTEQAARKQEASITENGCCRNTDCNLKGLL